MTGVRRSQKNRPTASGVERNEIHVYVDTAARSISAPRVDQEQLPETAATTEASSTTEATEAATAAETPTATTATITAAATAATEAAATLHKYRVVFTRLFTRTYLSCMQIAKVQLLNVLLEVVHSPTPIQGTDIDLTNQTVCRPIAQMVRDVTTTFAVNV